jgi:DDE superfamily endonuclease
LKDWIRKQYTSASAYLARENEPRLLTLDAFAPQMTKSVMAEFKKINCITSYIPGGCTSFVQVLDVSLNKTLKALVAQAAKDHANKYASQYEEGGFTVGDRRVLLTKWVGKAWERLHIEYKDTIVRTFRQVGLSLNPNGSEDHEIKIKGLDGIVVGNYTQETIDEDEDDGLGSLTLADITAIEAAKVKLAARVEAKRVRCMAEVDSEELDTDDEEHEEVQTLGRMSTRSQLRSQVNRYFTAMEATEEVDVMEEDNEDDGEPHFDTSDDDDDFDQEIDGDQDVADENM